ncbi:efflux RND transporter periplasmic adaptor subunit [Marinibacterium profundimaris]|nr:efflux RND transporter periplasmic adaptor subunit [Marinibacterium profundimaris]
MRTLSRTPAIWLMAILALSLLFATSGLAQEGGERPPTPVTVVTLKAQDVVLTADLPGRVTASRVAEVRPQVNGIVTDKLFEEGQAIEEGQPMFHIDDDVYEADLAAAQASLAQSRAQLDAAERELKRVNDLLDRNVATQQAYDDAVTSRDAAAASVKAVEASLRASQINLERATIKAPISGLVGLSQVTQGALVTAGQSMPLAVIRDIDPVFVDVTQSAASVLRWRRSGNIVQAEPDAEVRLLLADGSYYEQNGKLSAAEPHVNELTGVVVVRLEFPNPDGLLLPGMYVQVEVPEATIPNAILAPQEGVTRNRRGVPTAFVVNADNVIEARTLDVVGDQGPYWVVSEGLEAGDRIVVAGLQKIAPGAPVAPQERQAPAASE